MSDGAGDPIEVEAAEAPPVASSRARLVIAVAATLLAGIAISIQTSVNGHVGVLTGSPTLATAINYVGALIVAVIIAGASGGFPRAWRRLRQRRGELRWWWFLGGIMGFGAVLVASIVAPIVGVVAVSVGIILGQLAGSSFADSVGLGPGGRRALKPLRVVGIGIAVAAIAVGAIGRIDGADWWAIVLLVVAGGIVSLQQAANGWLVVVTRGEWAVMSVINFTVGTVAVVIGFVIAQSGHPADFAAVPWWAPLGGILGIAVNVTLALVVRRIGMLTSVLCIAAGQAIGAIAVDLVVPVDQIGITVWSALGAALSVCAVGIAGLGSVRRGRAVRAASGQTSA